MAKKEVDEDKAILEAANKEVGKETLRIGLDYGGISKIDSISTRALSLDIALGIGGVPRGRVVEI